MLERVLVPPLVILNELVGAFDAFFAACLYVIHEDWDIEKILKKAHSAASSILKTEFSSGNIPNIKYL